MPEVKIFEDTRQQKGKHDTKHRWFEAHGISLESVALTTKGHAKNAGVAPSGDYCREGSNIAIDTKRTLQEMLQNLTRDHNRIVREIERCTDAGYRLVFLIETPHATCIEDLYGWINDCCRFRCAYYKSRACRPLAGGACLAGRRRKPVQGATLAKIMLTMEKKYRCKMFYFCTRQSAARMICELLGVAYE